MTTLDDATMQEVVYGVNRPMSEHPRKGQYAFLRSSDPNIDGAIARIDRPFVDWLTNNSPHALTYIRRLVTNQYIDCNGNAYQVTVHLKAPQADEKGPFRDYQAIIVHESEIGKPYNGVEYSSYDKTPRFNHEALEFNSLNPQLCIFQNCLSESIRVTSVLIDGTERAVKMHCDECRGNWTQLLAIMGAK